MFVKNARKLLFVLLLMIMFCANLSMQQSSLATEAPTWDITTVASTDYSYDPSLALDSKGQPHISYQDSQNFDLKYAFWNGNKWVTSIVDPKYYAGYTPSLELDSNDRPHISYVVRWIHGFEKTVQEGNSLIIEKTNMGSLKFDRMNFDMETDYLKYAVLDGDSWAIKTIDGIDDVNFASLRLDSKDQARISCDGNPIRYVVWNNKSWDITTIKATAGGGAYPSLALDSKDQPHICYLDNSNIVSSSIDGRIRIDDTKGILRYARFTGDSWEVMTVDSVGNGMDINLELDSRDRPHISYSDKTTHNFKYAVLEEGSWNITPIDSASVVTFSSLALDSNDRPHISYTDNNNNTLKYVRFIGTDWEILTVDSGFADSSLVLDKNDCPHMSYVANNTLKYAVLNDAFVLSSKLSAPLNLQATVENGKIALSWIAPNSDGGSTVTNYNIYRGITSGNGTLLATIGNSTTYVDESSEVDKKYYYQVSAINSVGEGAKSNEVTATLYQPFIQAYSLHIALITALVVGLIVTIALVRKLSVKSAK